MWQNVVLIVISVALATMRICGARSAAFQAAAHVFVGGLFTAMLLSFRPAYLILFLALGGVETLCFSSQRLIGTTQTVVNGVGVVLLVVSGALAAWTLLLTSFFRTWVR